MRAAIVTLCALSASGGFLCAGAPQVVLERARVASAVTTVVEVGRQYQVTREVPSATCVGERFTCTTETRFAQLYQVTVRKRLQTLSPDGRPRTEDVLVHRELFATDLGQAAEQELESRLERHIRGFHPEAALQPFATRITGREPLPFSRLYDDSRTPTWKCTVDADGSTDVDYLLPREDGGYEVGNAPKEVHAQVCDALTMTILPEDADVYETAVGVLALDVLRLGMVESWHRGSGDERSLQPVPTSLEFEKVELEPEAPPANSGYRMVGGRVQGYSARDGMYRAAFLDEVTVEAPRPESAAWTTRWSVERLQQRFDGPPSTVVLDRSEILLTWLPLVDPLGPQSDVSPRPPAPDWMDRFQQRLRVLPEITTDSVFALFRDAVEVHGKQPDALLIVCDDAGARFALTAFNKPGRVTNGRAVCDAIERQFGDDLAVP